MTKKLKTPLEQVSRAPVGQDDILAVVEEVRNASDRAAAVHLGAFVERKLNDAFLSLVRAESRAKLEKEISEASFKEKIEGALKFGLVDDRLFKNLELIRRIRNAFAHSARAITFETPEVVAVVGELTDDGKGIPTKMLDNASPARIKFASCCMAAVITVGFRAIGRKADLMGRVVEALSIRLNPDLAPHAETIKRSAELLKKFEM
jgi:hypothetical protein